MAAPKHRFAAVDWPPRRPLRHQNRPPATPPVHSNRQNRTTNLDIVIQRRQRTVERLAAAHSVTPDTLLRSNAYGLPHSPMMARHLKFATLVFIALAIVLLVVIKFGFDEQVARDCHDNSRHERSQQTAVVSGAVVCVAVACACAVLVGCALSLCRTAPPPAPRALSPAPAPPAPSATAASQTQQQQSSQPSEYVVLQIVPTTPEPPPSESPEAPPPYKIAVLMPGRESPPPPAYSELR